MNLSGTRGDLLRQFLELDPELESVLWKVRTIPGSIALWQQAALAYLAKQYNREGAVLLNIGTKYGLSTACLCLGAPKALVHTLEPSPKRSGIAKKRLSRYNAQVHTIKSWAFLEANPALALDMVFVDGCHRHIQKDLPWFTGRLKSCSEIDLHPYRGVFPPAFGAESSYRHKPCVDPTANSERMFDP